MPINSITVSQLNTYVKSLLENDIRLLAVNVSGEISNFKNHFSSGHWYFTLKDQNASIRCVMFKGSNARVKFAPEDGLSVVVRGKVSLYEKDGQYQFYVEEMHPVGEGDLALAFKQVKEKLEKEGLFNPESKRPLVKYPKCIAVITSETGAAVRDILNITAMRYPVCKIVMCPVLVQGDLAANDMIKTLDRIYALESIDCIIIGRGGGSAEDLHCFNDEALARKIYESPFPVISAVGHETDFTICDFVADVRASTPSHAAELAVPNINDLLYSVHSYMLIFKNALLSKCNYYAARLETLKNTVSAKNIEYLFQKYRLDVDKITDKIESLTSKKLETGCFILAKLVSRIDALSPLKVMTRGFSVASKNGLVLKSVSNVQTGDNIKVAFYNGEIDCKVTSINKKQ